MSVEDLYGYIWGEMYILTPQKLEFKTCQFQMIKLLNANNYKAPCPVLHATEIT